MLNPYIEGWQVRELVLKKELKLREVAEFFNRRIEKLNQKLGAYMTTTPERALADADRLKKSRPPISRRCRCTAFPIR